MVVVRESPNAKLSPDKSNVQWPPKSPFQALMSSPGGRRRWEERKNVIRERSLSPSPSRIQASSGKLHHITGQEEDDGVDEDDDEETLQLKLQALQAKIKLKKLRTRKKEDIQPQRGNPVPNSTIPFAGVVESRRQERTRADVEVPLSPVKERTIQPQDQLSPARRKLGLDVAMKAENVSLKRARDGSQIKRANSTKSTVQSISHIERPQSSFSERLRQSRVEAEEKRAKAHRVDKSRSKGFGMPGDIAGSSTPHDLGKGRDSAPAHQLESLPDLFTGNAHTTDISRGNNMGTYTNRQVFSSSDRSAMLSVTDTSSRRDERLSNGHANSQGGNVSRTAKNATEPSGYDPFSQLHLSKRRIPHTDVARALHDKEIYPLRRLLKEVKAPEYNEPDCENDYVVFGVLASKSSPFDQKQSHLSTDSNKRLDASAPRNKFMVLHLTDLHWEVDCFLFGTAFDQFWKLTPGTLLAILNPAIMAPKVNIHSGAFSLKLGSSEDCVMEIGTARDLSWCTAIKKDGQQCGSWIDKSKTDFCDFHINLAVDRERKGRMEVNTMSRGFGAGNGETSYKRMQSKRNDPNEPQFKKRKDQGRYHTEYGRIYGVPASVTGGNSAASILDAEDMDTLSNLSSAELSRKRLAEAQKERDLVKALSKNGSGVGAEYLRAKHGGALTVSGNDPKDLGQTSQLFAKPSASELGLTDRKAADVHLSPAKDRKRHFGLGGVSTSSAGLHRTSEAMGWGGARKAGLLQPKESQRLGSPERGQQTLDIARIGPSKCGIVRPRSQDSNANGNLSPSKKRARFMLDNKGIREPGRESGGQELLRHSGTVASVTTNDEDDDDDLLIV